MQLRREGDTSLARNRAEGLQRVTQHQHDVSQGQSNKNKLRISLFLLSQTAMVASVSVTLGEPAANTGRLSDKIRAFDFFV